MFICGKKSRSKLVDTHSLRYCDLSYPRKEETASESQDVHKSS